MGEHMVRKGGERAEKATPIIENEQQEPVAIQLLSAWFWCWRSFNIPFIFTKHKTWFCFISKYNKQVRGVERRSVHGRSRATLGLATSLRTKHRLYKACRKNRKVCCLFKFCPQEAQSYQMKQEFKYLHEVYVTMGPCVSYKNLHIRSLFVVKINAFGLPKLSKINLIFSYFAFDIFFSIPVQEMVYFKGHPKNRPNGRFFVRNHRLKTYLKISVVFRPVSHLDPLMMLRVGSQALRFWRSSRCVVRPNMQNVVTFWWNCSNKNFGSLLTQSLHEQRQIRDIKE